jgi:hypothetical protein
LLPAAAVLLKAQLRGTASTRLSVRAFAGASIDQQWAYKMILIENELDLLKQLKAAGEHGRTIRTFDTRLRLDRLVVAGTKHGESALSDASRLI